MKPAAKPTRKVRLFKSNRGFYQYGALMQCTYGTTARVVESSSAEGPHLWLFMDEHGGTLTRHEPGKASMHLNQWQARDLIRRLQTWLDQVPSRWNR